MRINGFLRTPIRYDHQNRMQNLLVKETDLCGNPVSLPYPQSLEINFTTGADISEVQIAPLWGGFIRFIPDIINQNPSDITNVNEAQYSYWSTTGDLILRTWGDLDDAFNQCIPFVKPSPTTVRYSKVQLTKKFLFTTIKQTPKISFIYNGIRVNKNDPQWFEKFIIKFLQGKALLPCRHNNSDATKDFALNEMPSVKLEAPGTLNSLYVTVATLTEEVFGDNWFSENPAYDGIDGVTLVDAVLDSLENMFNNPLHPSHSVIPPLVIFQEAMPSAYAPDHTDASPLREALSKTRAEGITYRRIDLIRPPIPSSTGYSISMNPQRPYPTYKLCWRSIANGVTKCLRIPLYGRLYLPLKNNNYTFWAIPRSAEISEPYEGDHLHLSVKSTNEKYIGIPQASLNIDIGTNRIFSIYAHLHKFDSLFIFHSFKQLKESKGDRKLKRKALSDWNAPGLSSSGELVQLDWTIPTSKDFFSPIYGYIRESAGRHGLSPEFLHSVLFGEGFNLAIRERTEFIETEGIDAYCYIGLDLILYRLGIIAKYPEQITDEEEIAEFQYNLETNGYVDKKFSSNVEYSGEKNRCEGGRCVLLKVAKINGWRTAIELVAAELHQRLDDMSTYCKSYTPPIPFDDELRRRYLTYIRYLSKSSTAKLHANNIANELQKWEGKPPPEKPYNSELRRFKSLQRISVAQWYEEARVYR